MQRSGLAVISRLRSYYDPESRSPEARRAVIDPVYFGERYIKPHDARWTKPTAPFQKDMVRHILEGSRFDPEILKQVARPEEARELATTAYRTMWVPIEHAKTTWVSITLPLWILAVDQETKICLIGNRAEDAQKSLGPIRWHLENNQLLRADFPELRPDYKAGWSEERIFVVRRDRSKDPSIQTTGITGTIQGARLDVIFGDDVQDRKRALSEVMNQADQENWQEIIENRVVDGGICATYGTLQTSRDLVATMSRSPGYSHLHLSAFDETGRYGKVGEPIWMTQERLAQARARQGERRFARKYLNDAKDEGGKQLKAEWLKFVSRGDIDWNGAQYFAGVDPATGEAESADPDEYVICYGIRETSGRIVVLGFRASRRWGIMEGTRELAAIHRKHAFRKVAIESVAFQVAQKQHIWAETDIPAYKSPTSKSKDIRFENMAALFDVGKVVVYDRGEGVFGEDDPDSENFYDQWIDYPEGRHDDRLDACEKMLEAASLTFRPPPPREGKTRELLNTARFLD